MVNKMPKPYRYYILYGTETIELDTDPMGWEEYTFGLTRSEDFGLNVGNTVTLSFLGNAYDTLKSLYQTNSVFSKAYIQVEERGDYWGFTNFYTFRIDFTKYESPAKVELIRVSGIEEGLLTAIKNYSGTEYEIDLPTTKQFMPYSGVKIERKNLLQCSYGSIQDLEQESIGEDAYVLRASRALRAYTETLSFVNDSGEPYDSMTIRCIQNTTFDLSVSLKCAITANGTLFNPASGSVKLVKYNPATHLISVLKTYSPISTSVSSSKRKDIFNTTETVSVTIAQSELLYFAYYAEQGKPYDDIMVEDCFDTFISVTSATTSSFENPNLEVFSYEWLIESILTKIHPDAVLNFNITYNHFVPMLSATPCIKNMGSENGAGRLKVKLSDVLKSIDCLYCTGFDISGNTITIDVRDNFYKDVKAARLRAKDIVVKHDIEHQFNKITVGYDTEKMGKDSDLTYPFNCEKIFEIKDSVVKNELDIKNPFMGDPYEIENYIQKIYKEADNTTECKFMILCIDPFSAFSVTLNATGITKEITAGTNYRIVSNTPSSPIPNYWLYSSVIPDRFSASSETGLFPYSAEKTGYYDVYVKIVFTGTGIGGVLSINPVQLLPIGSDIKSSQTIGADNTVTYEMYGVALFTKDIQWEIQLNILSGISVSDLICTSMEYTVSKGVDLYRDHIITGFNGNVASVFNVPITPKRILRKHLKYISVSNYGGENDIAFVSTTIDSAITSRCAFETEDVVENADEPSIEPMFLPSTIDCQAVAIYGSGFNNKKYDYIEIINEKNGKVYKGWIKTITFAPNRNKGNQLILTAKTI